MLTNTRQTYPILDLIYAETVEIERHFHNTEEWFGKMPVQTATDWGTPDSLAPFRAISGLGVYGADPNDEAQVLGTADTPFRAGMTRYDPHRIFIVDFSHAAPYILRIVWGSGTFAAAVAALQYSMIPLITPSLPIAQAGGIAEPVMMPRLYSGIDKLWVQCKNANDNAYIDFLIGIHEYAV